MRKIDRQLAALADIDAAGLKASWPVEQARPTLPPDLLRRLLAYRLQEQALGALPAAQRRMLAAVADGTLAAATPPKPKPGTGSRLIREWQGRTITVDVEADGYRWEGELYPSLSRIARAVTGAHWSGPRFFGIAANG